eukprot:CAMPEP_0118954180 /NCGR_PEP_ID=MMETSP1169-20130426/57816_1 /TAXON_ID=36882 /ORGANISM="Pyramimonas obovata, Strain CCMP722" /LENGTH=93 /DNA_ID=CAMNT_0006901765 /DNA_START=24 /DNA_END=301 /DNA_ORIENTATION=+
MTEGILTFEEFLTVETMDNNSDVGSSSFSPYTPPTSAGSSPSPENAWHDLAGLGKPQGITTDLATQLGRDLFGLPVHSCKELPSERDRNFLLT